MGPEAWQPREGRHLRSLRTPPLQGLGSEGTATTWHSERRAAGPSRKGSREDSGLQGGGVKSEGLGVPTLQSSGSWEQGAPLMGGNHTGVRTHQSLADDL